MSKTFWLMSAGMFALATTPAYAQDQTSPTGQTSPVEQAGEVDADTDVTATDAVASADEGDIVITAQGRAQILQDVPLAVSAVSAASLQNSGANDIRQLNQLAPSLLVSSTGSEANGSARIRGIGTVGDNPGLESSVAVFVDGVYRSRSGIGLNELGEIERVEVLRGPQGTLFGRNASAGIIHIISKKPNLNNFEGFGSLSYGNFNYIRADGGMTGPIGENLGFRLDGVYVRRDGFYHDVTNDTDVNDRNRFFVRGQLLYEPSDALSVRLIADYTHRDEKCCGAVYLDNRVNPLIGNLNERATPLLVGAVTNPNGNNIINVLQDLGAPAIAFHDPFSRNLYVTPGRSYAGTTEDMGVSAQVDYDLGGASLTSITAWRDYDSDQGSDTDYGFVDILYRAPDGNASRRFKTLSQELRLQGKAFGDHLDWLVGAYFADERLRVTDNLRFGTQYGRFATCRIISGGGLSGLYSPTNPSCVIPGVGPATIAGASGAASGVDVRNGFATLDALNDRGSTLDIYRQNSRNWALFTHNIFHITNSLSLTLGLRYTNERKKFSATFGNDNTACQTLQNTLTDDLTSANATARALAGALIGLGCQGNATAELNGVSIADKRSEDEFTGTAILSWKPTDNLLLYASYSRGYKAGGFNLDRSALKAPILVIGGVPTTTFAAAGGAQSLVHNLQFDPEINNAYELGAKFSNGPITVNAVFFRQDFENFQLNTFNGSVFLVQTINGCENDLAGADRDLSGATGACPVGNVGWGVRSQGIELETALRPARHFNITMGVTYASTHYRDDIVGNISGAPLDPALRKLPGDNLSNAPKYVMTNSVSYTPPIGGSGLSALFYVDSRLSSGYNTGSDLFPQKEQESFWLVNARVGIRGRAERWSVEFWAQNLFNEDYAQVAFNSPFQAGTTAAPFVDPQYPGGRQIFSAFLAEPRTYGITGRIRF
ncbi:MAG: iron complex outerrane recepter protein [Sphingomonadales bacterium]|nr:iron complex outerrane recepter protein [Sphingomonadales bacterium]